MLHMAAPPRNPKNVVPVWVLLPEHVQDEVPCISASLSPHSFHLAQENRQAAQYLAQSRCPL